MDFTDDAQRLLAEARVESDRWRHEYIGTEHVLLALLRDSDTVAAVLAQRGIDRDQVRQTLVKMITPGRTEPSPATVRPYTTRTSKAFSYAADVAHERGHPAIGPEDVLIGLMRERLNPGAQVLQHHGLTEDSAAEAIRRLGR